MLTLLGIPNCDTVRKTRAFFDDRGIDYRFRDIRKEPLDRAEWRELVAADHDGKLVNTRGPSFRKAGVAKEDLTPERTIELLVAHPTAMKRPVVLRDGALTSIGFSPDRFELLYGAP